MPERTDSPATALVEFFKKSRRDVVSGIDVGSAGVTVQLASGGAVHADRVLLAAGHESQAVDLYRQSLDSVLAPLSEAGIPVIVLAAVPEMTGYTDRTSLLSSAFGAQAFDERIVERHAGRDHGERELAQRLGCREGTDLNALDAGQCAQLIEPARSRP